MTAVAVRCLSLVYLRDAEADSSIQDAPTGETVRRAMASVDGCTILPASGAIGPIRFALGKVSVEHSLPGFDFILGKGTCFHFAASVDVDEEKLARERGDGRAVVPRATDLQDAARSRVSQALDMLLLCARIAIPQRFEIESIEVPGERPELSHRAPFLQFNPVMPASLAKPWPLLRDIDVMAVHRWISPIEGWPFSSGTTHTGRALAALTHVCAVDPMSPERLVWALAGLEALFCDGTADAREQLARGAQDLLGSHPQAATLVDMMFEDRSRFLRGAMPLPFLSTALADWGTEAELISDRSTDLATTMLVASIQELVVRQWTDWELYGTEH